MTQVQPRERGDQPGLQGVLAAEAAGQAEEQEQVGVSFQCFPMLVVYDDIVCDMNVKITFPGTPTTNGRWLG